MKFAFRARLLSTQKKIISMDDRRNHERMIKSRQVDAKRIVFTLEEKEKPSDYSTESSRRDKSFDSSFDCFHLLVNDQVLGQFNHVHTSNLPLPLSLIPSFRSNIVKPILPEVIFEHEIIILNPTKSVSLTFLLSVTIVAIIFMRQVFFRSQSSSTSSTSVVTAIQVEEEGVPPLNISLPENQLPMVPYELKSTSHNPFTEAIFSIINYFSRNLQIPEPLIEMTLPFLEKLLMTIQKDLVKERRQQLLSYHDEIVSLLTQYSSISPSPTVKSFPTREEGISVLELFSGIGGMRLALPKTMLDIPIRSITAVDINPVANQIYEYNFHHRRIDSILSSRLLTTTVEAITLVEVDGKYDVWTMSPPCQPYTQTKNAHRKDHQDPRSKGFYHLMKLLLTMQSLPRWILFENVKGFVDTEMYQLWHQVLETIGYHRRKEYLVSPDQALQTPNSRMRYYLIAEYTPSRSYPSIVANRRICKSFPAKIWRQFTARPEAQPGDPPISIQSFLFSSELQQSLRPDYDEDPSLSLANYGLTPELFQQKYDSLSLVNRDNDHSRTTCFTKGYSQYLDHSSGSFLRKRTIHNSSTKSMEEYRLFHPNELLALFGFPADYRFPLAIQVDEVSTNNSRDTPSPIVTLQQCYACIGNSVNIRVIQAIWQSLFDQSST